MCCCSGKFVQTGSGMHAVLMVLGMVLRLLLGRRPTEEARYLISLLAQDEDVICVAMWICKSYENKIWFGKTGLLFSYSQCINCSPWFCSYVLTSFSSCCLNNLETKVSRVIQPLLPRQPQNLATVVDLVRLCGPSPTWACCCCWWLQQGTASEATHQGP